MITQQDDALESRLAGGGIWVLEHDGDERLDLENLGRFFHDERVELEAEMDQVLALDGGVRAGHRDHLGVLRKQKVAAVV